MTFYDRASPWIVTAVAAALALPVLVLADDEGIPAPAATPAPAGESSDEPPEPAASYTVTLTGVADDGLRGVLEQSSALFSLKDSPPPSLIGLERRADTDRERLGAALRSAGYYDARLAIAIDRATTPLAVTLTVDTGPIYRFKTLTLETANGAPLPGPAITADSLGLPPGEEARGPAVVAAQTRLTDGLVAAGYAFAKVTDRRVVVDHSDRTMDVTFIVDPGPLVRFGPVTVEGVKDVDPALIRGRIPWKEGDVYDPARVTAARTDIAKLETFEMVRVALADQPGPDGVTPVTVMVSERKQHFIGAGVTYTTADGFGLNGYWGHRNLFGGAEQLRLSVDIARLSARSASSGGLDKTDFTFGATFRKPDFLTPHQSLVLSFTAVTDNPPAYGRDAVILSGVVERVLSERLSVSAGLTAERARLTVTDGEVQSALFGVPLAAKYDASNDLLNPTEGYRITGSLTPWFPMGGDTQSSFVEARATGSAYWGLSDAAVLAGRLSLGSITGAGLSAIPPHRRFYAGGGGSVRGFAFQKAGPRDSADKPTGGRSLAEAGVELRYKITDTIGVVPFVDAGGVYDSAFPDFSTPFRVGAGLGVRYYTPFGPLRVDVGFPLNPQSGDARWQLYLSLGQAF